MLSHNSRSYRKLRLFLCAFFEQPSAEPILSGAKVEGFEFAARPGRKKLAKINKDFYNHS